MGILARADTPYRSWGMLKELRKREELDEFYLYAAGKMIEPHRAMATELPFRVHVLDNEV